MKLYLICLLFLVSCASKTTVLHESDQVQKPKSVAIKVLPKKDSEISTEKLKRIGKKAFFKHMKPLVVLENAAILHDRKLLQQWQSQKELKSSELKSLKVMAQSYHLHLKGVPQAHFWHQLLKRVDMIPLTLVLVQAANESAWGNSRFAREANNYFGQWCYQKGCGLVPLRRNAGAKHEVKRFASAAGSIRAYMRNLNTSASYKVLRNLRLSQRRKHDDLNASFLALGLKAYSERGIDYVKTLRNMIRHNQHLIQSID